MKTVTKVTKVKHDRIHDRYGMPLHVTVPLVPKVGRLLGVPFFKFTYPPATVHRSAALRPLHAGPIASAR